jgi:hypothetical protein
MSSEEGTATGEWRATGSTQAGAKRAVRVQQSAKQPKFHAPKSTTTVSSDRGRFAQTTATSPLRPASGELQYELSNETVESMSDHSHNYDSSVLGSVSEGASCHCPDCARIRGPRFGLQAKRFQTRGGVACAECAEAPSLAAEEVAGEELGVGYFGHSFHSWKLFRSSLDSPRHLGVGEPLENTSWLNRPYSVGFFLGVFDGDNIIAHRVDQGSALFGGARFGWDFDHYWGLEGRLGWSSPDVIYDPPLAVPRTNGVFLGDVGFLYYPLGDAAWRPYALVGMGVAMYDFVDNLDNQVLRYTLGIPVGLGLKYYFHPNLALRAEFLDNISVGTKPIDEMNNLSFTLGMELRYGGPRRSYYPWHPGKQTW